MTDHSLIPLPALEVENIQSQEQAIRTAMEDARVQRLPGLALIACQTLYWLRLGNVKKLYAKLYWHHVAVEREKRERPIFKTLSKEARLYARLLKHRLAMLGQADFERENGRRRFKELVRFEPPVYLTPEIFYFRIKTVNRGILGSNTALPYRVRIAEIISEESLFELSHTINRHVTARHDSPRKGVWLLVHRNRDMSGLPQLVRFSDMLPHYEQGKAQLILGISELRRVARIDLENIPHALVGGETGGGKSNMLNAIICGLIRHNSPAELQLVLIDLKAATELGGYDGIPHLPGPIIEAQDTAHETLKQILAEVHRRLRMLKGRARSLPEYNRRALPANRIPRLVVIIDELAELLLGAERSTADSIERTIVRIGNLGRAVGVHMIVATQRPGKEVVSTSIKLNMALRVAGKMATAADSLTILGTGDAAQLDDVPGRMCYKTDWHVIQVQSPKIEPHNIAESIAIAMYSDRIDYTLPSADELPAIEADSAETFDFEAALQRVLDEVGGRLVIQELQEILGIPQGRATLFQRKIETAGPIDIGDKTYQAIREGKTLYLRPVVIIDEPPVEDGDTEESEPVIQPDQPKQRGRERWTARR